MLWTAVWLGIAAGAVHAGTGPDHLAGVAPFAARRAAGAWRVGVAWGLGHAAGAATAAAVALLLRAQVPGVEENLSAWSERIVGVLLCAIGAFGLHRILRTKAAHAVEPAARAHGTSAFALGLMHGAAGLSHLFGVLPALALPGTAAPALYLGGYAVASLAVLTVFAAGIGRLAPPSRPHLRRGVVTGACAMSLVVGVFWLVRPV